MERQIPKNVRQIGNVSDSPKIYVEDYVDTFFLQLSEKSEKEKQPEGAFLIGEDVYKRQVEVCDAEESASGSCTDQALYSGDGDWSGCTSGQDSCGRRQSLSLIHI